MEKNPKKKNRTSAISPFALAATLAILGAGAFSVSGASAASRNNYPQINRSHWNNSQSGNNHWQNMTVLMGTVTYAGPSHLKIQTQNNDYYFNVSSARIVGRNGSLIKISDINKNDHLVAYGHFSDGTFSPNFIRNLSRN
ncbi:MAG: hypothetical protein P4L62_01305 [Candidatus Pacebacteria bacterium]|nr:hypothetical protein [Candidatus Paceibacterota bacterium]MDR3582980.1 hypothetical protein [Candidatus Paceibacterota bacterium]